MLNTLELQLHQAYKKLKSHLYTDKTLLQEKVALSYFELNLDSNIQALGQAIEAKNIDQWLQHITYRLIPKKLKPNEIKPSFYTNQTIEEVYSIQSYNIFIDAPIEIHLLSTLWTMLAGEDLDEALIDNIQGNRLYRDKNKHFSLESYKLFRPYYEGYQNFRDDALDMAVHLHSKELDVSVLNIDIKEFYYNIPFKFSSLNIVNQYDLNGLMQKVHDAFHQSVKGLHPNTETNKYLVKNFLPIGLVSSSVIANHVLSNFDKDIMDNMKPEYYGRYVDDMLFVFSNARVQLASSKIIHDLLSNGLIHTKIESDEKITSLKTNSRKFILQNEKVKLFQFYKNDSISLLEKFKETIEENSSFFNFMPDEAKLFKTLESSSYTICYDNSENKLSSLVGTTSDGLRISRNLSGVLAIVSCATFSKEEQYDYNRQIESVFRGKNIFGLKLYWEKLSTYLYITKNDALFVSLLKAFVTIIKSVDNVQGQKLSNDTLSYLYHCVLLAVAPNPSYFFKTLLPKIEANGIEMSVEFFDMETRIFRLREANMFSNFLMTYPLINYNKIYDEKKVYLKDMIAPFNFLTKDVALNSYSLEWDEFKSDYSPRFIHYHEIILHQHYLSLNGLTDENFYRTDTEKVFEDYKRYNGFETMSNAKFPEHHKVEINLCVVTKNDDENKEKLKIGIVSMKTVLSDIEQSYVSSSNLSYKRLQGIFNILNHAIEKEHKVDLLVFPEVSIPYAWVHHLAKFAKKNNIGIVFGVEHIRINMTVSNMTCIMLPFEVEGHSSLYINFENKKHFSPTEKMDIESRGFIPNENTKKENLLYKWRGAVFSVFNCYELTDISYRSSLVGKVDFIVAIEYNKDTNYFSTIIDSLSRDLHCYVIQVNTSDYGDSRILRPSKTELKDIVKLKGGKNIYLVVDEIDIKALRNFQLKGHCIQQCNKKFKLIPPFFVMRNYRKGF